MIHKTLYVLIFFSIQLTQPYFAVAEQLTLSQIRERLGISQTRDNATTYYILYNLIHAKHPHELILTDTHYIPDFDDRGVIMSDDKKRFFSVIDSKLTAFDTKTGRRLWQHPENKYIDPLIIIGDKIFAETYRFRTMVTVDVFDRHSGNILHTLEGSLNGKISANKKYIGAEDSYYGSSIVVNTDTLESTWIRSVPEWSDDFSYEEELSFEKIFLKQYGLDDTKKQKDRFNALLQPYSLPPAENFYPLAQLHVMEISNKGTVALAGTGEYIFTINTQDGSVATYKLPQEETISLMHYSYDGNILFAVTVQGSLYVYSKEKWQRHGLDIKEIRRITSNNDGSKLWLATNKKVYSIELLSSKQETFSLLEHTTFENRQNILSILALEFSQSKQQPIALVAHVENNNLQKDSSIFLKTSNSLTVPSWEEKNLMLVDISLLKMSDNDFTILSFSGESFLLREGSLSMSPTGSTGYLVRLRPTLSKKTLELYNEAEIHTQNIFMTKHAVHIDEEIFALVRWPSERGDFVSPLEIVAPNYNGSTLIEFASDDPRQAGGFQDVAFDKKGIFLTLGTDYDIGLWNFFRGTPNRFLSYYFFQDGNYLVTDRFGYFDSPHIEKLKKLHWINRSKPTRIISFEEYMGKYRSRNLLQRYMKMLRPEPK